MKMGKILDYGKAELGNTEKFVGDEKSGPVIDMSLYVERNNEKMERE